MRRALRLLGLTLIYLTAAAVFACAATLVLAAGGAFPLVLP